MKTQFSHLITYPKRVNGMIRIAGASALQMALAAATLLAQPVISKPPLDQSVSVGANVTLQVIATGTAPLTYQWRFNSTVISGQTTASLTLPNVQTANAGAYDVLVANASGVATSRVAVLEVDATFTKITCGDIVT